MTKLTPEEKKKIYLEEKERHESRAKLETESKKKILIGYYVALLGSLLLIGGLFLPWARLGIFTANGFQKTEDCVFLFCAAVISGMLCLIGLSTKKKFGLHIVIINLIAGALIAYIYFALEKNLSGVQSLGTSAQIGTGFFICMLGIFMGIIGGGMLADKRYKSS